MAEPITAKQEKFSQKVVEIDNASEAYRQSYDARNMSDEAIRVEAHRLLQNPNVSLRVAELREYQLKRHQATADRVIAELSRLAFLDIRKAFDEEGRLKPISELDDDTAAAIAGLEVESLFEGRGSDREVIGRLHKIKLSDKKGALDSLARHLGMFSSDTLNLNVRQAPLPEEDRSLLDEYAKGN